MTFSKSDLSLKERKKGRKKERKKGRKREI
jgi:hypothetical protein